MGVLTIELSNQNVAAADRKSVFTCRLPRNVPATSVRLVNVAIKTYAGTNLPLNAIRLDIPWLSAGTRKLVRLVARAEA